MPWPVCAVCGGGVGVWLDQKDDMRQLTSIELRMNGALWGDNSQNGTEFGGVCVLFGWWTCACVFFYFEKPNDNPVWESQAKLGIFQHTP